MALLAPLLALVGRFLGKILNMAFGWASVMLFGRVPQSKQLLLSAVSLGAIAWLAALVGVLVPLIGTLLLAAVPAPGWIDDGWLRLAMVILAVVLPLLVGLGGTLLLDPADRPHGARAFATQVLRGYPYAAVLAVTFLVMIVVAPARKIRALSKRWEDTHIPMLVQPGGYARVADDVERAVDSAGVDIARAGAPWILEVPSKLLATVGGASVRSLVPDRLLVLRNPGLEVTIHPTDLAISGKKELVARARAAIAARMTFTAAYLTAEKEAQQLEDRLRDLADVPPDGARAGLREVDRRLATLVVPQDEWDVLYRKRLQVERDLLLAETRQEQRELRADRREKEADAGRGEGGVLARLVRLFSG